MTKQMRGRGLILLLLFAVLPLFGSCTGLLDKAAGLKLPTKHAAAVGIRVVQVVQTADLDSDGYITGAQEWQEFVVALIRNIRELVSEFGNEPESGDEPD